MAAKKILVTGVYGLIASRVYKRLIALPEEYEVYALARRQQPSARAPKDEVLDIPEDRFTLADLSDMAAVERAVEGMDTVVQLAADPRPDAGWDDVLDSNIVGLRNIFEASHRAGVKRMVYASSIMVSWGYQQEEPYKSISAGNFDQLDSDEVHTVTHRWPLRPTGLYPASKIWGEALARYYADVHQLSTLCLRIGWVNAEDHPHNQESGAVWCSQRDVVQLIEKAVQAPDSLDFGIFYGVSNNKWRWVDIDHARLLLGYIPQDSAEGRLAE